MEGMRAQRHGDIVAEAEAVRDVRAWIRGHRTNFSKPTAGSKVHRLPALDLVQGVLSVEAAVRRHGVKPHEPEAGFVEQRRRKHMPLFDGGVLILFVVEFRISRKGSRQYICRIGDALKSLLYVVTCEQAVLGSDRVVDAAQPVVLVLDSAPNGAKEPFGGFKSDVAYIGAL